MTTGLNIDKIILNALEEDIPSGDITTDSIMTNENINRAVLICKEDGVISGLDIFKRVFTIVDESIKFNFNVVDGENVTKGFEIATIKGRTNVLLKCERTALNLLQRLSGITTETKKFVDLLKGSDTKVVDTRKTTPGLRLLEKYAVRIGGGHNHRYCLSDGILIKDNHIMAAGGIKKAIEMVKNSAPHTMKIEVEVESIEQVKEALDAKADIIMLDNMSISQMREAVLLINKCALVEASGNVNLETIADIGKTGVDIISVGALTHSVKSLDISMKIV